jgi:putative transposase
MSLPELLTHIFILDETFCPPKRPSKERLTTVPRANRYFIPGQIWHLTHRCHKREFLLKFARDRRRWLRWLFLAKKRYGLRILNYALTSNHVHLLVEDGRRRSVIPCSMDLVSGRVAQEYNRRKGRSGAFWQDRYHGTAIQSGEHLKNCLAYIDLNMVRAGVVRHPREWPHCGYNEICSNRRRYGLIHWPSLLKAVGLENREELRVLYPQWIEERLKEWGLKRAGFWTESLAVGSKEFVDATLKALWPRARRKRIEELCASGEPREFILRESTRAYGGLLGPEKRAVRRKGEGK